MPSEILVKVPPVHTQLGPVRLRVHQLDFALETRTGDHVVVRMLVTVQGSLRPAQEAGAGLPLDRVMREVGQMIEASASALAP
jgi:hypothetical protein